jgi:hypothetical protein
MWTLSINSFGAIRRSPMRRCMTVRCSLTCCSPSLRDATCGPMRPISRKRSKPSLRNENCARGFSTKVSGQAKGCRNKPLTTQQTSSNRHRPRIRARVEQVYGHQIMAMGGNLVRTIGRVRARAKIGLKNLTYNFQRFRVLTTAIRGQLA